MSSDKYPSLKKEYFIHSYEADLNGKVSIISILKYFQETAWIHAEQLGVGYSHIYNKNLAWILSRLSVKMYSYPKWGEKIFIKTWPTGLDNLYCYRDFKILNEKDEIIGKATSTWFVVDIASRRPQRTSTYIDLNIEPDVEKAFEKWAPKLGKTEYSNSEYSYDVKYSDIDVNGHVNNVNYLKFTLDTYKTDFIKERQISELHINFQNETLIDDSIKIFSTDEKDQSFAHSLFRAKDDKEICKLEILFQ